VTLAATISEIIAAWPLAFLVGVVTGLALASRYRIVKMGNGNTGR